MNQEHPTILERAPVPSERTVSAMKVALFVLVLFGAVWLVVSVIVLVIRTETNADEIDFLHTRSAAQDEALREANRKLVEVGETPVEVPDVPTPEPGEQGDPGERGDVGQTGPRGPVGATGPQGPAGDDGSRGPRGFTGLDGPVGPSGPAGVDGAIGPAGAQGPQGQQGPKGDAGPAGPAGEQGPTGPAGPVGPAGTANPGTYLCPDGEVVVGFTIGPAGGVTLTCEQSVILP